MADAPIILGGANGLIFKDGDGPKQLPIRAIVSGTAIDLSDGASYFQDTGITPSAIVWSGTFEANDNFGTPIDKAQYVYNLFLKRTRTILAQHPWSWTGFVQDATLTPIAAGRYNYAITFKVEVQGAIINASLSGHHNRARSALDALDATGLSKTTQNALAAVKTARSALGF